MREILFGLAVMALIALYGLYVLNPPLFFQWAHRLFAY